MNKIKESNTEIEKFNEYIQDLVKWLEKSDWTGCTKAETKAIKKNVLDAATVKFLKSTRLFDMSSFEKFEILVKEVTND